MIYVTGDLHGPTDISCLSSKSFPEGKNLHGPNPHVLLVAGDTGLGWSARPRVSLPKGMPPYSTHQQWEMDNTDEYWINWLNNKPWKTLAVRGNHEQHDFLDSLPISNLWGGRVQTLTDNIHFALTGEVYVIDGLRVFTYGGATSSDKIQRLADAKKYEKKHCLPAPKQWWSQEVPTDADYSRAIQNLEACGWEVDVVLSHTCPQREVTAFLSNDYDQSTRMCRTLDPVAYALQDFKDRLKFKAWVFGHFHTNLSLGRFHCRYKKVELMEDILAASKPLFSFGG